MFLALLMGVALWFAYGGKSPSPATQPGAVAPTQKQAGELQPVDERPEKPSVEAVQSQPVNARKPLPVLDTASPVYQSALVLLENRFIRLLERETQAEPWPPEQLVDLANRLAKLRLTMAMYEANIADHGMSEHKAVIVIPAYPREGEDFHSQLRALMPPDFGSEDFQRQLFQRFGYYGRYAQQLEVKPIVRIIDDQPMKHFDIMHRIEMDYGSSVGGSQLTDIYLGPYAPFIGAFPKE